MQPMKLPSNDKCCNIKFEHAILIYIYIYMLHGIHLPHSHVSIKDIVNAHLEIHT